MDKLSNEISFSSDSPHQVEPVRGSGTSATSHLLLANRINVRACHVRSRVAIRNASTSTRRAFFSCVFMRHMVLGGALRLFPVFSGPCFGDTRRQTLVSVHLPERSRLRSLTELRSPERWLRQRGVADSELEDRQGRRFSKVV